MFSTLKTTKNYSVVQTLGYLFCFRTSAHGEAGSNTFGSLTAPLALDFASLALDFASLALAFASLALALAYLALDFASLALAFASLAICYSPC
jgi:hypothetical protein